MQLLLALVVAVVACAAAERTEPEQIHLSLGGRDAAGNPSGMYVAWFTHEVKHAHHDGHRFTGASKVQFGLNASLGSEKEGSATQYLFLHGYHHAVLVDGLPASTRVFYRVGDGETWSAISSFVTAPNSVQSTVRISIFGDMGYKDSTERPMKLVEDGLAKNWSATFSRRVLESLKNTNQIDAILHVGDIAYVDDAFAHHPVEVTYEETYNGYMNWLQNLTSVIPYMVSVGNHESENHAPACLLDLEFCGLKLNNFTAYNHRWHMPSVESGGLRGSNMWYSFNYGPLHVVSINTETDFEGAGEENKGDSGLLPAGHFGRDGEYLAWLEEDLRQADAARKAGTGRPWIIANGHRQFGGNIKVIESLFRKYNVDVYFCGHGHSYSRSMPAFSDGTIETHHKTSSPALYKSPRATTWIMVGGAGCDEMTDGIDADSNPFLRDGGSCPVGSQVATYTKYATGVLVADPNRLSWRLIDSATAAVVDELVITK